MKGLFSSSSLASLALGFFALLIVSPVVLFVLLMVSVLSGTDGA
jgi:hypothetical protein